MVGVVATWRNDPSRPADLLKVHIERQPLTWHLLTVLIVVCGASAATGGRWKRRAGERKTGSGGSGRYI